MKKLEIVEAYLHVILFDNIYVKKQKDEFIDQVKQLCLIHVKYDKFKNIYYDIVLNVCY